MDSIDKLREIQALREKRLERSPEAVKQQHKQGKLTARERIDRLVDAGSFQEVELWASPIPTGLEIDKEDAPGDAVITGYGEVNGRPIYLFAQDFTQLGGTMAANHARKIVLMMDRALRARVPLVGIIDSLGVRLEDSVATPSLFSCATIARSMSLASGIIPQVFLVMGPCTGEAALCAGLTDFVFMVKDTSYMYAAPSLPEGASHGQLGSAFMHARVSGCCDLVAENDLDCLQKARELLDLLPLNRAEKPPTLDTGDDPHRREESLLEIVPANAAKWFDMREVIRRVVDNGIFLELKPDYAGNMTTGFARLGGQPVGFVATNSMVLAGAIDVNAADKEARFVRFCDAFNIPLIFFSDTPAYLPGPEQERGGLIRHGAKDIYAIAEATVPKVTVYIRKLYGGGVLAMCNQALGCDMLVAWPTLQRGLMGPEAAARIIYRRQIEAADNPEEFLQQKITEFEERTQRITLKAPEDFIDPRETRPFLVRTLKQLAHKNQVVPARKHGNITL